MRSMHSYLSASKNKGLIDFIDVPLDWGRSYCEFIVYSFETGRFSRIFFDNKYREDYLEGDRLDGYIHKLATKTKDLEQDAGIGGIYDSTTEFNTLNRELDFYDRYRKRS